MAPAPASRLVLVAPRAVLSGVPPPLGDCTVYCSSSKHFLLLASPCLNKKKTCILRVLQSRKLGEWEGVVCFFLPSESEHQASSLTTWKSPSAGSLPVLLAPAAAQPRRVAETRAALSPPCSPSLIGHLNSPDRRERRKPCLWI